MLIGVPTSAGAHHAGQDRAPAALRAAGMLERLRGRRRRASRDAGDLPGSVFAVDHEHPRARNLAAVVAVARAVADAVAGEVAGRPAAASHRRRLHHHARASSPASGACTRTSAWPTLTATPTSARCQPETSGILDATGISHLLGDGEPELAGLAGRAAAARPGPARDGRAAIRASRPTLAARSWPTRGVSYAEGPELAADPAGGGPRALAALGGRRADRRPLRRGRRGLRRPAARQLPALQLRRPARRRGQRACACCWPTRPAPGWC